MWTLLVILSATSALPMPPAIGPGAHIGTEAYTLVLTPAVTKIGFGSAKVCADAAHKLAGVAGVESATCLWQGD